jgi:hypothetical protein
VTGDQYAVHFPVTTFVYLGHKFIENCSVDERPIPSGGFMFYRAFVASARKDREYKEEYKKNALFPVECFHDVTAWGELT